MSNNQRGRPTKSAEEKKIVKQDADKRRYLQRKSKVQSLQSLNEHNTQDDSFLQQASSNQMVVQESINSLQKTKSTSFAQLRDSSVALTEDTVDISTEHDLDNIERDELAQWLQQKSRRWPQLVELENMLDDMEISEEEAFMCMQEEDQEREGTEESSESFKQGTSDRQEDVQVEKDSSGWPKLSGLEQILYDMEIERVATENMMGKKLNLIRTVQEDLNQVENYSSEEEQEQDIQKRKEKNVFRLSHIRADLRFQEEENTSSNENTEAY
ncbi:hypothetical protein HOY82DRAFT_611277 [Tuber indicum]|nr:hypothetical protein HOY82DRAFT_611277 [Tuber indicum]